jgi:glutamate 5-kinase
LEALEKNGRSLLRVGVESFTGDFYDGDAVEIHGPEGEIIAKGLVRVNAESFHEGDDVVVHRDDMVLLRRR